MFGWSRCRRGAGFGQVELGGLGDGDQLGVRHLDRNLALQLLVVDEVDPAESSLAEQGTNAVPADMRRAPVPPFYGGNRLAGSGCDGRSDEASPDPSDIASRYTFALSDRHGPVKFP